MSHHSRHVEEKDYPAGPVGRMEAERVNIQRLRRFYEQTGNFTPQEAGELAMLHNLLSSPDESAQEQARTYLRGITRGDLNAVLSGKRGSSQFIPDLHRAAAAYRDARGGKS